MRIYMEWYGGGSYAAPTMEDREEFSSIKTAEEVFLARAEGDPYFPCVEDSSAYLFAKDAEYPEFELRVGPRGGVQRSRC